MGSCTHLTFTTRNLVIVSMVNPSYYQIRFDALFFNEVISCVTFPRLDFIIQFNAVICWFWYVNTAMKEEHGQWTMHIFVSSTVAVIEKEGYHVLRQGCTYTSKIVSSVRLILYIPNLRYSKFFLFMREATCIQIFMKSAALISNWFPFDWTNLHRTQAPGAYLPQGLIGDAAETLTLKPLCTLCTLWGKGTPIGLIIVQFRVGKDRWIKEVKTHFLRV